MEKVFKPGDKIIWDSHFGYDLGIYIGESIIGNVSINIVTGKYPGVASVSRSEVYSYTEDKLILLTARYGYEKKWSDNF